MEEYEVKEGEEVVTEFAITKEHMECFGAGVLAALLFVMVVWALHVYSHVNWS